VAGGLPCWQFGCVYPGAVCHVLATRRSASRWPAQIAKARDDAEKWQIFTQLQTGLLQALGYSAPGKTTPIIELVPGQPLPLWQLIAKGDKHARSTDNIANGVSSPDAQRLSALTPFAGHSFAAPQLAIVPAYQPGMESEDLLDHQLGHLHYSGQNVPPALKGQAWAAMVSEALFGAENPPRYVILLGLDHWLLLDRYKWPNNRALRFDWVDTRGRGAGRSRGQRRGRVSYQFAAVPFVLSDLSKDSTDAVG